MSATALRIDPGIRPAVIGALFVTASEVGLFEAAAIFGAFPTYVARFVVMVAACLVAFAWLRKPVPSLRNLLVVPYLIRSLLFATTVVLLILAFSTSPSLNHTYTIFMLHIAAAYIIARLPWPLKEPLTRGKLWDGPFALAIGVLLVGIYFYHFVATAPGQSPEAAAAEFSAGIYAFLSAVSFAAANIMATYFKRAEVKGVEGRPLTALELTFIGAILSLAVAPIIAVLLQVPITPDAFAVAPGAALAFAFWAIIAGALSLPSNTLLFVAFSRTSNPALISALDALVLVFALIPDLLWHGEPVSDLLGTKGLGLALILAGGTWATYRDATQQ